MKYMKYVVSIFGILLFCSCDNLEKNNTGDSENSILGKWEKVADSTLASRHIEYVTFNKDSSVLFSVDLRSVLEYWSAKYSVIDDTLIKIYDQSYNGQPAEIIDTLVFFHIRTSFAQPNVGNSYKLQLNLFGFQTHYCIDGQFVSNVKFCQGQIITSYYK